MTSKLRRAAARVAVAATAVATVALGAPVAQANEMTIGGGGSCDFGATVWWNVPPDPGQRPAGATISWGCLSTPLDPGDLITLAPLPIKIDPIEP